jgi:hypothetical protein
LMPLRRLGAGAAASPMGNSPRRGRACFATSARAHDGSLARRPIAGGVLPRARRWAAVARASDGRGGSSGWLGADRD